MANYDDWKATEPDHDRWHHAAICQKVGCTNPITFPNYEVWCSECLVEHERRQRKIAEEMAQYDTQVRR